MLGGGFLDFSDRAEDLDSLEIGGEVTFQEPYDLSNAAQLNWGVGPSGGEGTTGPLEDPLGRLGIHHLLVFTTWGFALDG